MKAITITVAKSNVKSLGLKPLDKAKVNKPINITAPTVKRVYFSFSDNLSVGSLDLSFLLYKR